MTVSPPSQPVKADWSHQLKGWLGGAGLSVQLRVHGSCLHIVFEGRPCPPLKQAIARVRQVALDHPEWVTALKNDGDGGRVTYLLLYGRLLGQRLPAWTRRVSLGKLTQMVEAFRLAERKRQLSEVSSQTEAIAPTPPSTQTDNPKTSPPLLPTASPPDLPLPPSVTTLHETQDTSLPPAEPTVNAPAAMSASRSPAIPSSNLEQSSQEWAEYIAKELANRLAHHLQVEAAEQNGGWQTVTVQRVAAKILPPAASKRSRLVPRNTGQRRLLVTCACRNEGDADFVGTLETTVVPAMTRIMRQLPLAGFDYGYGIIKADLSLETVGIDGDPVGATETPSQISVRVNLRSPTEQLKSWARWGDVEALGRLFDRALGDSCQPVTAQQQETTLYVFCREAEGQPLEQSRIVGTLAPIAQAIAPQGIHSLVIYGYGQESALNPNAYASSQGSHLPAPPIPADIGGGEEDSQFETPLWIDWVDLPAMTNERRAESAIALAAGGYLQPLAHVLERRINDDVEHWLATGGRQVVCDRHSRHPDTLQVVIYGPDVPDSEIVVPSLLNTLRPLPLSGINRVVIYGQSLYQSHWESTHTLGRQPAKRKPPKIESLESLAIEPFIAPASDSLNAPAADAPEIPDAAPPELTDSGALIPLAPPRWSLPRWQDIPDLVRNALIQVGVCAPIASDEEEGDRDDGLLDLLVGMSIQRVAAAGLAGILAAVALDLGFTKRGWLASRWLPAVSSQTQASIRNGVAPGGETAAIAPLPELPSFNSPQFDHQLELYRQFVLDQGRPDVLVVGSSRALRGFDPGKLNQLREQNQQQPLKVFNLSVNGATAKVIAMVLVDLLPPGHLPPLVIWADGARAFNSGRRDGTHGAIAQSPGYRLVLQDQFPLPDLGNSDPQGAETTLAGVRALDLPKPPTPSAARSGKATDNAANGNTDNASNSDSAQNTPAPTLVSSREISPFVQETALGYWLKKLPTEVDFDAWLEGFVGPRSGTYGRRSQLRAIAQAQLQNLPIVDLWSQAAPPPEFDPVLELVAAGAQRRLGNAPAITNGKQDGIVDESGFLPLSVEFNPDTYYETHPRVPGAFDNDYRLFSLQGEQSQALKRVTKHLRRHRSELVFVNVPLTTQYLDPMRSLWDGKFSRFMRSQDLTYLDFATLWPEEVTYFSDPSHLNRNGARALIQAITATSSVPWPQPTSIQ
ncbi:MAG: hypothetical protein AAF889_01575 [Cyanobacteria bacterium P01_D01_bin.73]